MSQVLGGWREREAGPESCSLTSFSRASHSFESFCVRSLNRTPEKSLWTRWKCWAALPLGTFLNYQMEICFVSVCSGGMSIIRLYEKYPAYCEPKTHWKYCAVSCFWVIKSLSIFCANYAFVYHCLLFSPLCRWGMMFLSFPHCCEVYFGGVVSPAIMMDLRSSQAPIANKACPG